MPEGKTLDLSMPMIADLDILLKQKEVDKKAVTKAIKKDKAPSSEKIERALLQLTGLPKPTIYPYTQLAIKGRLRCLVLISMM